MNSELREVLCRNGNILSAPTKKMKVAEQNLLLFLFQLPYKGYKSVLYLLLIFFIALELFFKKFFLSL